MYSPSSVRIEGKLVLSGGDYNPSFLLDMKTGEQSLLLQKTNASVTSGAVSPDGKWLAYQEYDETAISSDYSLGILSADGQTRTILPWERNWRWIVDWLDVEHLLITRARGEFELDTLILLNPYTDEQKELIPDYPDILNWYPNNDWQGYSLSETIYDPSLTRVVYPQLDKIVLRDVDTGKELAVFPDKVVYSPIPKWSPDGQQVIVVGSESNIIPSGQLGAYDQALFSISRDGQIQHRLT